MIMMPVPVMMVMPVAMVAGTMAMVMSVMMQSAHAGPFHTGRSAAVRSGVAQMPHRSKNRTPSFARHCVNHSVFCRNFARLLHR
jgi:hypothetical protein